MAGFLARVGSYIADGVNLIDDLSRKTEAGNRQNIQEFINTLEKTGNAYNKNVLLHNIATVFAVACAAAALFSILSSPGAALLFSVAATLAFLVRRNIESLIIMDDSLLLALRNKINDCFGMYIPLQVGTDLGIFRKVIHIDFSAMLLAK